MSSQPKENEQKMITITLPDGKKMEFTAPVTGLDVATSIGPGLAKAAIAVIVDGDMIDLSREIKADAEISIVTRDSDEALELIRHDAAHVMAEAVQELFPGTQVTIGPCIENGFFYDFAREGGEPFSTEDLQAIEKKMRQVIGKDEPFVREVWERDQAIKHFEDMGESYKAEIIRDLPEGEDVSIYRQGEWYDLCRGPHLPSTKHIGNAFKLMSVAGAYWRGDSNNAMLQRIYGTAWRNDKELKAYLTMLEEAEKRDHRKLGREMDLFHLQEEAMGSVFWHPKGFTIWKALEHYIRARQDEYGYDEVKTPQLLDSRLWEKSGHWSKFRENMFVVPDVVPNTDEEGPIFKEEPQKFMALKPMNCPAHIQIFKQGIKSYRDLPIRMSEFGCCHRNEAHGALHGIMRVRQMTQDDAHVFCREDQITDESRQFCEMFFNTYKDFGFEEISVKIATRPEVRAGEDETWDKAEKYLMDALDDLDIPYEIAEGEGAFYGPKYEFHLKDAIGRSWQCGTMQLDFVMPERLDATYVGQDGEKYHPVMIHRAVFGTFERFLGLLIESYAGKLPLWLAPVQAVVTTITSEADEYAEELYEALKEKGLRVDIDLRNEKINRKIREHSVAKTQRILVVGAREKDERKVAIRSLGTKEQKILSFEETVDLLLEETRSPLDK